MRERRALEARPWEEHFLHWARDGTLHGTVSPPPDRRRRSTTADGWCPAWALEEQRRYLPDSTSANTDDSADQSADAERDD